MPVTLTPSRRITAESEALIAPIVSRLTRSENVRNIVLEYPDGTEVSFNGKIMEVPRGVVETQFQPKRGNINTTRVAPPSPSPVAPQSTPVPARTGMLVKFGNLVAVHQFAIELGSTLDNMAVEVSARLKLREDWEIATNTLASVQPAPQRIMSKVLTRTMTRGKVSDRRKRIHGFSNR